MTNTTKVKFYETTISDIGLEEKEIRDLLYENIFTCPNKGVLSNFFPPLVALSKESRLKSRRLIDILCKENTSNKSKLVVIEVKRGESKKLIGQAISYAAELEKMLKDNTLNSLKLNQEVLKNINTRQVRIILVSSDTSQELELTIEKLQKLKLDIQHVKIIPYEYIDRDIDDRIILKFVNETQGFFPDQPSIYTPKSGFFELQIDESKSEIKQLKLKYEISKRKEIKPEEVVTFQDYVKQKDTKQYKVRIDGNYITDEPQNLQQTIRNTVKYLIKHEKSVDYTCECRNFLKSLTFSVKGAVDRKEFIRRAKIKNLKLGQRPPKFFFKWRYLHSDKDLIKFKGWTYSVQKFQTKEDGEYLKEKFCKYFKIRFEEK